MPAMLLEWVLWWPFGAVVFSFVGALIIGFNQWAQIETRALLAARFAGVLPLAAVAFYYLPWPHDPWFYAAGAAMGLLLATADWFLFRASATHGARLAALYVPMKMLFSFAGWLVLAPQELVVLAAQPLRLLMILGFFGLAAYAMNGIRKNDSSWKALLAVLPVAVLFALGDVVAKVLVPPLAGTDFTATLGGVTAYLLATNAVCALVGVVALRGLPRLDVRGWVQAAGLGALIYAGIAYLLVVIVAAPNPGYVAAVSMLSALWLALWARFMAGEKNDMAAGLLLLIAALGVALLAV